MFENGRRSATSTSELGLYSDRSERYHRSRYGFAIRKYVIGVMVILTVIVAGILWFDLTSGTSVASKAAKETKHIYILQNALKKPINVFKKHTTSPYFEMHGNQTEHVAMQDRSDDIRQEHDYPENVLDQVMAASRLSAAPKTEPEVRSQNMNNFELRKRLLEMGEDQSEGNFDGKQYHDNHASVYRKRQRFKPPVSQEESNYEDSPPAPFHFEFRTPHPSAFKRPKYPQLSQYQYPPHSSNNIQEIIKYLTHDAETPNRGIKFTGVYVNPKKYDLNSDAAEASSNSDTSEEEESSYYYSSNSDPFYQYKPKNPSDVNLLATSNVRFSPSGLQRYNPYYDPHYSRPSNHHNKQPSPSESQYENSGTYVSANPGKKRKPKPFSVMLDIYPITDISDSGKKPTRPRLQSVPEEYDPRRPVLYNRGPKFYSPPPPSSPIPFNAGPSQDEEDRQQMIFHLNLYPRKKNKLSRNDIVERSQHMLPEETKHFVNRMMSPFHTIAKQLTDHSAIQASEFEEADISETEKSPMTRHDAISKINRYEETALKRTEDDDDLKVEKTADDDQGEPEDATTVASSRNLEKGDSNEGTEKYEESVVETVTERACGSCGSEKLIGSSETVVFEKTAKSTDIDTVEGFQSFADGLLHADH